MTTETRQELAEFIRLLRHEFRQAQRPADQVVLDDQDVMKMLKISKRKLQYMRANREIPYHLPISGVRSYYLLSDILHWLKKSRVESIANPKKLS
jgi:predicted DNA-binding transcriptional regulator AlpA